MSKHLQQLEVATQNAVRKTAVSLRTVSLKANISVLVLVLVIIPTISGVTLIA